MEISTRKMASSTGLGRLGVLLSVLGCFLVVLQHSTANKLLSSAPSTFKTVKVSELPLPPPGILGLSPLIKPIKQTSYVIIYYPHSTWNPLKDRGSYDGRVNIFFQCVQSTRRISVHANPEWLLAYVRVEVNGQVLAIGDFYFNPADETLVVDMVENFKVGVTYTLRVVLAEAIIDEDDRFGIQMFNRTRQDTGDVIITTSLSGAPNAMRRFIPCFDDPTYIIPYRWEIYPTYGIYGAAIAMMNGPRSRIDDHDMHYCDYNSPASHSYYGFDFPSMAIEATQLRLVPFMWHPQNDAPTPPPPDCFTRNENGFVNQRDAVGIKLVFGSADGHFASTRQHKALHL